MALELLAAPLDVVERLGRALTPTEENRVEALLRDASAKVRNVSTQTFTLVEDDVVYLKRSNSGRVRLPQRPVVSVASVTDVNDNAFSYTRVNNELRVSTSWLNAFEVEPYRCFPPEVKVTYTHGGEVPDAIIAVVCSIVGRALGTEPDQSGIVQEGIDGYSYTTGSAAAQGGLGLLASEREVCESFRFPSSPISMMA